MNNDEDTNGIYYPNYVYELENEELPLECPFRQRSPFPSFPQGSQRPQGSQGRPPTSPPNFTPTEPQAQQFGATPFVIDQGAISPCVFRFVYIWPRRERGFWAWLTFVGRRSVSGFRFNRSTWRYFGMDLREIRSFECF